MSAFFYVLCVNLANLTFNAYHYLNGVLLVFVSPHIRIPFLHFIGFYKCFCSSRPTPKAPAASASVAPAKT
uniref:Secreted protein n=1 Tax=Panagrellus redivivus TaxID=6233 RepID=A0A7E4VBN5_PANRE